MSRIDDGDSDGVGMFEHLQVGLWIGMGGPSHEKPREIVGVDGVEIGAIVDYGGISYLVIEMSSS